MSYLDLIYNRLLPESARIIIVSAHYDDEVLGAASILYYHKNIFFIHLTDSAPENMEDAVKLGLNRRLDYSRLRYNEFHAVLDSVRIPCSNHFQFDVKDQDSAYNLVKLTLMLTDKIKSISPDIIFTHPYEGGHPDHDSASFAVHNSLKLLEKGTGKKTELLEFSSYFQQDGEFRMGSFIPSPDSTEICITLNDKEIDFKSKLVHLYESQKELLKNVSLETELFRKAPEYNFSKLPHNEILYDRFNWGLRSDQWLVLTGKALRELKLEE